MGLGYPYLGIFSDFLMNVAKIFNESLKSYRSLRASCFRSTNSGSESLNSLIFSSKALATGICLTSLGILRRFLMKVSIPSCRIWMLRLAHKVSAHCSLAACNKEIGLMGSKEYEVCYMSLCMRKPTICIC